MTYHAQGGAHKRVVRCALKVAAREWDVVPPGPDVIQRDDSSLALAALRLVEAVRQLPSQNRPEGWPDQEDEAYRLRGRVLQLQSELKLEREETAKVAERVRRLSLTLKQHLAELEGSG